MGAVNHESKTCKYTSPCFWLWRIVPARRIGICDGDLPFQYKCAGTGPKRFDNIEGRSKRNGNRRNCTKTLRASARSSSLDNGGNIGSAPGMHHVKFESTKHRCARTHYHQASVRAPTAIHSSNRPP